MTDGIGVLLCLKYFRRANLTLKKIESLQIFHTRGLKGPWTFLLILIPICKAFPKEFQWYANLVIPFITFEPLMLPLLPTKLLMQPLNISLFIVGNILHYCLILFVQYRFYEKMDGWRKKRNWNQSVCNFHVVHISQLKVNVFLKSLNKILRLLLNIGPHKKGWASYALGWTSTKSICRIRLTCACFSYFDVVTCLTNKLSVRLKSFHNLPPTLLAGTCALKIWEPVPLVDIVLWCSA